MIQSCAVTCWNYVEQGILPLPEENRRYFPTKVMLGTMNIVKAAVSLPFAIAFSILSTTQALIFGDKTQTTLDKCVIPVDLPEKLAKKKTSMKVGATTAYYQTEGAMGCPQSSWARREDELFAQGTFKLENRSGLAVQLMGDHDKIIELLKGADLNAFRFSVEWSIIEPQKGHINELALQRYQELCQKLLDNDIQPMVTLHHFTQPKWFDDIGGFENRENLEYFGKFCEKIAEYTPKGVKHFCTINEPNIHTFLGYILGWAAPGKTTNFSLGVQVFSNLLNAHQIAYNTLKGAKPDAQVGISHQYLRFEPASILTKLPCKYLNAIINEPFLQVLRGEEARVKVPFLANRKVELIEPFKADWIGAQFYGVPYLDLKTMITHEGSARPGETMTEMDFSTHPEVAYEAIMELHKASKGLPIHVTESGIASTDPQQRAKYLKGVLGGIGQAVQEGVDVKSYHLWSLTDNWEWPTDKEGGGFTKHFGMYAFNPETREFTLRKGNEPISSLAGKIAAAAQKRIAGAHAA